MKIGLSIGKIGLKMWVSVALLFVGFVATESAFATPRAELANITAGTASNQSVRLILFGFAAGISALLICAVIFKPAAKASAAKWFHKILTKAPPQDSDSPSFLHDETR